MDYGRIQACSCLELSRRVDAFKDDFSAWTLEPRANALGLSPTQRTALSDMLDVVDDKLRTALSALATPAQPLDAPAFADAAAKLLVEMTGAQGLWRVFRSMLVQLEDPLAATAVRAANRVAGDCYTVGISEAVALGAIERRKYRETPLVYLEAVESPATAGRRDRIRAMSESVRQWRDQKLPLPIVILPADYTCAFWTFCGLHHEVGHNLDQDLGLLEEIRGRLLDVVPADQEVHWRRWAAEILADALGIVLGGVSFALSLGTLALMLGPAARFGDLADNAQHPPLLLRVRLLAEFLRGTALPAYVPFADDLDAIWGGLPHPAWLQPFDDNARAIAGLFLETRLAALNDHPLRGLNPGMANDHQQMDSLASFLTNGKRRPDPTDPKMRPRLVASAAQLALWRATPLDQDVLKTIHASAMSYLALVPSISTLGVVPGRREYLRQLAADLDLTVMPRKED